MDAKGGKEKDTRIASNSQPDQTKEEASTTNGYLTWLVAAGVLAGCSYAFTAFRSPGINMNLPSTETQGLLSRDYGLCAETGKIYTVDDQKPNVDCLVVQQGHFTALGTLDEIMGYWDSHQNEVIKKFYGNEPKAKKALRVYKTKPGSIVVPGITDSHAHLIQYGQKMQLQLDGLHSLKETLDTLEAYVLAHPEIQNDPSCWVEGMGWDQTRWKDHSGGFPTAADLASRPLLAPLAIKLARVDGHATWVSPHAMELALEQLPGETWPTDDDVKGGEIKRDQDGNPTGVFVDNAMALIQSPPWTQEQMDGYLDRATKDALGVGLTNVHDAASVPEYIDAFQRAADEGRLPIRVYAMGNSENTTYWGGEIPKLEDYGQESRLNLKSVKLFTDGALGSWGAALLDPYSDNPHTAGIMRISPDTLEDFVQKFWEDDWGINIHCIGDRANKVVLDIFERILIGESEETGEDILEIAARRRPRIEHAQIMREEDLQRAGRLGVITSVQPTHATSDMWYAESRLGPERIKGAYAYQTLLQASPNKILPLGSDFPVEGINPLLGFYAAVARLDTEGNSPHGSGGWYPGEKLTRAQALKGMTLDAAYASFSEDTLGSISPGKKADYVVLDHNILDEDAPASEILETKVLTTVVDGKVAYGEL